MVERELVIDDGVEEELVEVVIDIVELLDVPIEVLEEVGRDEKLKVIKLPKVAAASVERDVSDEELDELATEEVEVGDPLDEDDEEREEDCAETCVGGANKSRTAAMQNRMVVCTMVAR